MKKWTDGGKIVFITSVQKTKSIYIGCLTDSFLLFPIKLQNRSEYFILFIGNICKL